MDYADFAGASTMTSRAHTNGSPSTAHSSNTSSPNANFSMKNILDMSLSAANATPPSTTNTPPSTTTGINGTGTYQSTAYNHTYDYSQPQSGFQQQQYPLDYAPSNMFQYNSGGTGGIYHHQHFSHSHPLNQYPVQQAPHQTSQLNYNYNIPYISRSAHTNHYNNHTPLPLTSPHIQQLSHLQPPQTSALNAEALINELTNQSGNDKRKYDFNLLTFPSV